MSSCRQQANSKGKAFYNRVSCSRLLPEYFVREGEGPIDIHNKDRQPIVTAENKYHSLYDVKDHFTESLLKPVSR